MNNVAVGPDYKLQINMLMKQLYIYAVQYFYITNQLTMEEDYQTIYPSTTTTRSDYVTKINDGELIDIREVQILSYNFLCPVWQREFSKFVDRRTFELTTYARKYTKIVKMDQNNLAT